MSEDQPKYYLLRHNRCAKLDQHIIHLKKYEYAYTQ